MAKPKIPNQKKKYQELNNRLNRYVVLVEQIYDTLNLEAAKVALNTEYDADSDVAFKFSDYPQTNKTIADIQAQFASDIRSVIYRGTSDEWKNSNEVQDLMADKVLKAYTATIDKQKYKVLYQTNSDALKAFQSRKDKGFNVSAKLWQQSTIYKEELEAAISCAIQKGSSAVTLSKQISKYLLDFPSLQKDYKDKYGSAEHLKDCEYRSIRLARSEINMAYRIAENERWKQMDFVVGYEIKRSGREFPCTVCESLIGKYPKDFVWTGWHPTCRCYKIPILKTEEEFWALDGRSEASTETVNEVKDVPDSFKKWILDNQQRIDIARQRGTLPYFLKDNTSYVEYKKDSIVKKVSFVPQNLRGIENKIIQDYQVQIITDGEASSIEDFVKEKLSMPPNEAQKLIEEILDNSAPYMAIDSNTLMNKVFKGDGLFKSSIETGKGTFKTIGEERAIKERSIFGFSDDIAPEDYPKYGFLSDKNGMNNKNIVTWGYGDVYVKFKKDNIFPHSTYTIGDSYDCNKIVKAGEIKRKYKDSLSWMRIDDRDYELYKANLKRLQDIPDSEDVFLKASPAFPCNAPNCASFLTYDKYHWSKLKDYAFKGVDGLASYRGNYVECQIYGKLSIDDIESIEVSRLSTKSKLEKIIKKKGLNINVVDSKYSYDFEMFKEGITDYDKKFAKYILSLSDKDIDNIGDKYIEALTERFCEKSNLFWKVIKVPEDVATLQSKIWGGTANIHDKRIYIKWYEKEIAKKSDGIFPKVWYEDYSSMVSGWTEDVINKEILK